MIVKIKTGLLDTEEGTLGIGGKELSQRRREESIGSTSVQTSRLKNRGILAASQSSRTRSRAFLAEFGDGFVISSTLVADVFSTTTVKGTLVEVPLVADFVDPSLPSLDL